ncbi:MAG: isoprenylcysteine carboxylmethyltransferase family protein [Gammaproteobacteria bacterium]|nr:isoprenylcysteine carboxylmethyltransferase family protein [Gammaproteobacteria bacterium]
MPKLREFVLVLFIVWILIDAAIVFRWRTGKAEDRDRGSLRWIALGNVVIFYLSIHWAFSATAPIRATWIPWAGLVLMAAGIALRFSAIAALGRLHTPNVAVRSEHRLVDRGLYRLIRHPSYLGALIAFDGFGLGLGDWHSAWLFAVAMPIPYLIRIREEEAALREGLGKPYVEYCERTKRLVPWLY